VRILIVAAALAALAGCAYGPKVVHVPVSETVVAPADRLDDSHVYYALPRTLVSVQWPLTLRSVKPGLLHTAAGGGPFDPTAHCKSPGEDELVRRLCARRLRALVPSSTNQVAACATVPPLIVASEPALRASTVPVPDADHIYAVRMHAGAFEKLETTLTLSEHGAPTSFSATGTSSGMRIADFALRAAMIGILKQDADGRSTASADANRAQMIDLLNQMDQWDQQLLDLAQAGALSQTSRDVIVGKLQELRQKLEGQSVEQTITLQLVFDPPNGDAAQHDEVEMPGFCPPSPDQSPAAEGDAEKPEARSPPLTARLTLRPLSQHVELTTTIDRTSAALVEAEAKGLRYRVPVLNRGYLSLAVEPDQSPDACMPGDSQPMPPQCIPIESTLLIAQQGSVRALPRRLGLGTGAMKATLDAASGGLSSVTTETRGGAYDLVNAVVDEAGRDHELAALEREAKLLQQRVAICKSRRELGMAIPQDCNEAKSLGQ